MKAFLALVLVMLTCSLFAGSSSGPPNLQPPGYASIESCDVGQFAPVQVPTDHQFNVMALTAVDLQFIQYDLAFSDMPALPVHNYSKPGTITALQPEREVLKLLIPDRPFLNYSFTPLKTVFELSDILYNCPLPYS